RPADRPGPGRGRPDGGRQAQLAGRDPRDRSSLARPGAGRGGPLGSGGVALIPVPAPIAIWRFSSPVRRALAIQALFSFGLWGVSSTVMNLYLHGAGFSNDVIGYVNSMPAVAAILFGLPVASASDRYGRRPFLVTGTLVAGLGGTAVAFASGIIQLLAAAFLM